MTLPIQSVGQLISTAGFSASGASVLDPFFVQAPVVGTGVTFSQASGSLAIAAGTTANAEFLARSVRAYSGTMRMRFSFIASQRIANTNCAVLLADLIGENLNITINSSTSITIDIPNHSFTDVNIGQFVLVGGISGATGVPGRYAIASVVLGVSISLTVSGWPASGTTIGTVFGRNYIRNLFTGTVATNVNVDAQRNGWATNDTVAVINTTASPGTLVQTELTGRDVFFADSLRASATAPTFTTRASRYENIPDDTTAMYVFVWSFNGSTAPASSTTWTLGHVVIEMFEDVPVYVQGVRAQGQQNPLPVSGSVSVSAITAGATLIGDVGIQYRTTLGASASHIVSAATTNPTIVKAAAGKVIGWSFANTNAAWRYVKLHNQATAPTAGTGVVRTIAIPPNGISNFVIEGGHAFATGIGLTTVTGSADADATAVGAGDVVGEIFFA